MFPLSFADRVSMIPDLLLALASVAVLLSPLMMDAGLKWDLRRSMKSAKNSRNDELPSQVRVASKGRATGV